MQLPGFPRWGWAGCASKTISGGRSFVLRKNNYAEMFANIKSAKH